MESQGSNDYHGLCGQGPGACDEQGAWPPWQTKHNGPPAISGLPPTRRHICHVTVLSRLRPVQSSGLSGPTLKRTIGWCLVANYLHVHLVVTDASLGLSCLIFVICIDMYYSSVRVVWFWLIGISLWSPGSTHPHRWASHFNRLHAPIRAMHITSHTLYCISLYCTLCFTLS